MALPSELSRDRIVGGAQAAEFYACSLPQFRRLYRAGRVPKPIKIGERKYGWRVGTLLDYIAAKEHGK